MDPLFPALRHPRGEAALTVDDRTLSYAELRSACWSQGVHLLRAGLVPGERVAVWTQPFLETPIALLTNALFGFMSIPLSPSIGDEELRYVLRDSAPRLAIAARPELVRSRTPSVRVENVVISGGGGSGVEGSESKDSTLLILYTSGTTGPPKGAMITERNIRKNLDDLAEAWHWSASDTVVHALPLFHVHGLVLGLFGSLRVGGRLHWLTRFEPKRIADALSSSTSTVLFSVPTMIHRLADAAQHAPEVVDGLRAARVLISGSAGLPLRDHARIEDLTGRRVLERYGLTETLINCAVRADGASEPGTVGPSLRNVEVRLVDEGRAPLDPTSESQVGEIAVRGPNVFAGYLNRPEDTALAMDRNGWFYTGDLGCRTAEGSFKVLGRRSTDLIKTGGYKVGAGEVEACLLELGEVAEVAVVGLPDDDLGERIVAFVVPQNPSAPTRPDSLIQHVASQLSHHKRPREIQLVSSLPRNAMGKVMKHELRKQILGM